MSSIKPSPRNMQIGDTVVIVGGTNPKYIGLKATLLDLNYRERARAKGYNDYTGDLEIQDSPYVGRQLRLFMGNFKPANAPLFQALSSYKQRAEERYARSAYRAKIKRQAHKQAQQLAEQHPELYRLADDLRNAISSPSYTHENYMAHSRAFEETSYKILPRLEVTDPNWEENEATRHELYKLVGRYR